jgi:hypothetical protein
MPISRNYANIEANDAPTKPKKPIKRIRYSIFFITWNSNQYVADTADPKFVEMEAAAEKYFEGFIDHIADYIKIKNKAGDKDTIEKIKSINTDCAFEIGSEQRCFHAHMYVRVDHYTQLQLDIDRMRKEIVFELGGGYINVVASADTTRSITDYIHKHNVGNFPAK